LITCFLSYNEFTEFGSSQLNENVGTEKRINGQEQVLAKGFRGLLSNFWSEINCL